MTTIRAIPILAAVLLLAYGAVPAQAQISLRNQGPTTDELLQRISALETRVAQLESVLTSSGGQVVLDGKGLPVAIRGSTITIESPTALGLRAGSTLDLRAGSTLDLRASSTLNLKGAVVALNDGTRPVACGVVTGVGPGMASHTHPLLPCRTTVLAPRSG